ncbi:helix-turn-helix domain-containing protein [Arthrobacter sp. H14-L1]|uniref:helix-turn-helix domain-containing protein n=1 Tax=Arthrobacter sp. H14-L1 TaxID=2996697 RepID=UPI00226F65A8|nr:helix-turn-helix domain-containing protein [Arthrobacter sp. H14-L1]MCY0905668.1 GAF domain-containing protein [Arthrobacter sp. H14-L1]
MEPHRRPLSPAAIQHGAFAAHENLRQSASGVLSGSSLRPEVRESWERSLRYLARPAAVRPALLWGEDELDDYRRGHPLAAILPVIAQLLVQPSRDTGLLVAVGDQYGRLLWVQGDATARVKASRINFVAGADWSEAAVGTNAPGAAVATNRSIQIAGAEHFNPGVHPWSCTAVPLRDPDTGSILGILDITGGAEAVAWHTLALMNATVAAAQAQLQVLRLEQRMTAPQATEPQATEPQATEPRANTARAAAARTPVARAAAPATTAEAPQLTSLQILGRDHGLLHVAGRTLTLSERHTEILTLLALHPRGLSAEELASMVYPERAAVPTVRAEMVRLRRLLRGYCQALIPTSRPYRLPAEVAVDAQQVLTHLGRGAHRLALSSYRGEVLPRSEAPAIVDLRRSVGALLREAILTDAGPDVLLQYLQLPEAKDDGDAWHIALRLLPLRSPRRAAVVAHLERLRADSD